MNDRNRNRGTSNQRRGSYGGRSRDVAHDWRRGRDEFEQRTGDRYTRDRDWSDADRPRQGGDDYGRSSGGDRSGDRWTRGDRGYGSSGSYRDMDYGRGQWGYDEARGSFTGDDYRDVPRGDERQFGPVGYQGEYDSRGRDREYDQESWRRSQGQSRGQYAPGYGGQRNLGSAYSGSYRGQERSGQSSQYGRGQYDYGREHESGGGTNQHGQQNYAGRGPKGYQRSDDRLKEQVSGRLMDDSQIDASEITVEIHGGEVTLTGTVNSREEKRAAEACAETVSGVREVFNQLRVNRGDWQTGGSQGRAVSTSAQAGKGARSSSERGEA
jgi:osmotically-inducible protein OsmY